MRGLSIVSLEANKELFGRILTNPAFAEIEAHPQTGAYARSYYPAVHVENHRDLSFAACSGDVPILVCLCTLIGGTIGLHGLPLRLFAPPNLAPEIYRAAIKSAFSHIDDLAKVHGAREVVVRETASAILSPTGESCLARGAKAVPNLVAQVDLIAGPAEWRKALRKSFRSLINWGRRNFAVSFVNREKPDADLFERFRLFHAEVAGRVTRPQASWDVMYEWIVNGGGELVATSLDDRLVAASLFIDGTQTCIYMTGVYDRSMFDKPLAHYPLWLGIEHAQARGMRTLELGDLHFSGTVSEKEYGIGYFKRGFATHVDTNLVWRWSPSPGAAEVALQ